MRVVGGKLVRDPKPPSVGDETVIVPKEATARCRRYLGCILSALPRYCA